MRVSAGDLELLREQVSLLDTPERRARYLAGDFPRADRVRDLDTRYRWDLFWDSIRRFELSGYTNAHIDTALRRVVPPLTRADS